MRRRHVRALTPLTVLLALAAARTGLAGERPARAGDHTTTVYQLNELGDPALGAWAAETIPDVIAPGTWDGPGALRYFAPRNVMAVRHTAETHAKVAEFLKQLKHSAPPAAPARTVVPAEYRVPALLRGVSAATEPTPAYPVPAAPQPPKHLFHFIIRYEGQGFVDDNVVKAIAAQAGAAAAGKDDKDGEDDGKPAPGRATVTLPPTAVPASDPPAKPKQDGDDE